MQSQIEKLTKERDQIKEQHRVLVIALQECRTNRTIRNILIKNLMAEVKELKKKLEAFEQR